MDKYYTWNLNRVIARIRKDVKKKNLGSLDEFSNEAIIEGFARVLRDKKCNSPTTNTNASQTN